MISPTVSRGACRFGCAFCQSLVFDGLACGASLACGSFEQKSVICAADIFGVTLRKLILAAWDCALFIFHLEPPFVGDLKT
jgi:hypothetical protein